MGNSYIEPSKEELQRKFASGEPLGIINRKLHWRSYNLTYLLSLFLLPFRLTSVYGNSEWP